MIGLAGSLSWFDFSWFDFGFFLSAVHFPWLKERKQLSNSKIELEVDQLAQRSHIICLPETWLKNTSESDIFQIQGYEPIVALELNEEEVLASMLTLGQTIG